MQIYVDADACPVVRIIEKLAKKEAKRLEKEAKKENIRINEHFQQFA